jgi:hypothetical protein
MMTASEISKVARETFQSAKDQGLDDGYAYENVVEAEEDNEMSKDTCNMNGIVMSLDGAQRVQETGCRPEEDVRRIQAGEIDREGLLSECLDGVDEDDAAEWEAYVSDIMAHVSRVTPWRVIRISKSVQCVQPDDELLTLGWHVNLAAAMTAGEEYMKQHPNALLQTQHGEEGVTHVVG